MDNSRPVEPDLYREIQESIPITCVDAVLWRGGPSDRELLLIRREVPGHDDWVQGLALVGGRVFYGETIDEAIRRHITSTLGTDIDWDETSYDANAPSGIGQYFPDKRSAHPFDPRQHSIALTYLIRLGDGPQDPSAGGEATSFVWIRQNDLRRSQIGFAQWKVLEQVLGISMPE